MCPDTLGCVSRLDFPLATLLHRASNHCSHGNRHPTLLSMPEPLPVSSTELNVFILMKLTFEVIGHFASETPALIIINSLCVFYFRGCHDSWLDRAPYNRAPYNRGL